MNRSTARPGSSARALLVLFLVWLFALSPASSQAASGGFWFAGAPLAFDRLDTVAGEVSVGIQDSGLATFLIKLDATVSWQPGERYVLFTASDHRVISFTIGSTAYSDGGITARAPFAPYLKGNEPYIPFITLARALYVDPIAKPDGTVLQPQVAVMSVRKDGRRTLVSLRAPGVLAFQRLEDAPERLTLRFPGFGSALEATRSVNLPGLTSVDVLTGGSAKNPSTTVTFHGTATSAHLLIPSETSSELIIAFGPQGVALDASPPSPAMPRISMHVASPPAAAVNTASASPSPQPIALASATPGNATLAVVTGVDEDPIDGGGATVNVYVKGGASFEWHRLSGDDARFYVDLHGARLGVAARDDSVATPSLQTVRFRQFTPDTVRVSLVLGGNKHVQLGSTSGLLTLIVNGADEASTIASGTGAVGTPPLVASVGPGASSSSSASAAAAAESALPTAGADWKFGAAESPRPGTDGKLIVLDPGHGGSDPGAQNTALGLREKDLTLDIALRLRTILVAQGWTVRMTRETDTDVFGPNASDKDELQARCDVANNAGARMFVSIHINSFTDSGLEGTTTYYFKPQDLALATAIHDRLNAVLGTRDDGVRKNNFYVIHHTTMPAALVETAFLSNPGDAARLQSPAFLQHAAQAIADGIDQYAGSAPKASASADQ